MKKILKSITGMLAVLLAMAITVSLNAQDDLYYDPAADAKVKTPVTTYDDNDGYNAPNKVTRRYDNDDEGYSEEDDEYAYEYSSRIRRFHRPVRVVDYYDPFYVDLYNYDPYFLPGNTIYTYGYNDYWSWRRWQRWNRWNSWNNWNSWNSWSTGYGYGWNSWGWSSCYSGYSPWNNPWAVNNYYYDPYWTWNGYNPYYGNNWGGNHWYDNNNHNGGGGGGGGYRPQTYTGPRHGGTSVNPGYARLAGSNGRLTTTEKNVPTVERQTRPSGRGGLQEADPSGVSDRSSSLNSRRPTEVTSGRGREAVRSDARAQREAATSPSRRPTEASGNSREATRSDARPTREMETTPSRRPTETRPSREESRPSRPSSNDEQRASRREESRPSNNDRPSRTFEPSNDRPSRSGGSEMRSTPSRSESGGSSRSGGGGNTGGSSRSGGGRGGRQ